MQVVAPPIERRVTSRRGVRVALVVALAHGVTDMYASFVPPLLPRIMNELGLSIALAATLAVSYSIAGALPQPLLGYAADRFGRRAFAVVGPLVAGIFVTSIGFASSFWIVVALLVSGGLGSAAFHPFCFWALPAHLLAIWIGPIGALGLILTACAGFLGLALRQAVGRMPRPT